MWSSSRSRPTSDSSRTSLRDPRKGERPTQAGVDGSHVGLTLNRTLALVALAALAFGAWWIAARPAAEAQSVVADGAVAVITSADTARFTVAQANLALQRQTAGTYVGAVMPPGLALVRADVSGYCIQLADGGPVAHLAGPVGTPVAGACS